MIYIAGLGALILGGVLGFFITSSEPETDELEVTEGLERQRRDVQRRVQRKWRFRLRRRRKELKQRTNQVERLKEEIASATIDDFDINEVEATRSAVDAQRRAVQSLQDRCRTLNERLATNQEALTAQLVEVTGVEQDEFVVGLVNRLLEREESRAVKTDREKRQSLDIDAETASRRLITQSVLRYSESHSVDRLLSSIRVDDATRREKMLTLSPTFEAELGMSLETTDRENVISIRGADPLMKEISQRILKRMLDGPVDENVFSSLKKMTEEKMRRESAACSQEAIEQLGVGEVNGERRRLLDRLRYRHSYRQNQWRHAAEVGFLSGMLAWELDLDAEVARRGGLMHDIGKSMTHEVEGGHAVLGAEVARGEDEDARVASCIGAHHGDEPPIGLEPFLVAAGDAISGARPGARVQGGEHHEILVRDLERIGRSPRKVDNAYTVRGGRELRVIMAMEDRNGRRVKVSPDEMARLASDMKEQIEEELTYPGTIDVTLIRRVVAEVKVR